MTENRSTFLMLMMYLLFAADVGALAVSDIELKSSLNQPLEARIFLLVNDDELDSLQIRIIEARGAASQFLNLGHEIAKDSSGHYIKITSRGAIKEPILNFGVELNWAVGRFIREYTLLIDPQ